MLNSTNVEISKQYIPFNTNTLHHIVNGISVLKNLLGNRINDASVLIYQKTLDANSQVWNFAHHINDAVSELNMSTSHIDRRVTTGLLSIALMGMFALTACALSSPDRIQAQTVDLCTYKINDDRVLYEGGTVDLEGANIDQTSGTGATMFLDNPFIIEGGLGRKRQLYLVVYHGDTRLISEQSFTPLSYATPLGPCERVVGQVGSIYSPDNGYLFTTPDGRTVNAGVLRLERKKK